MKLWRFPALKSCHAGQGDDAHVTPLSDKRRVARGKGGMAQDQAGRSLAELIADGS
jgi:hypothetical protein